MNTRFIVSSALVSILMSANAAAQDAIIGGHSVESIRAALKSPIPRDIERMAQEFDDTIIRTGQVHDRSVTLVTDIRSTRANEVAAKLLSGIRVDPSTWVVRVLDTNPPEENAFVVGGKFVYIYTGLMNNVTGPDELAVVLGHEMSHSLLKHSLRRSEDFSNLLASILEIGGSLSRRASTKETLTLTGGAIKGLYSREDEQEADALGVAIAHKAGFNTIRGVEYFKRSIKNENAIKANEQRQFAQLRQNTSQALAHCKHLKTQWKSSSMYRTQQNAQIVNSTCQDAQSRINHYNQVVAKYSQQSARSILTRTHPVNEQRISFIVAATDHMKGRRSLESLSGMGQGYNVFVVLNTLRNATPMSQRLSSANWNQTFEPKSRHEYESCNSNSDCIGELECESGYCK